MPREILIHAGIGELRIAMLRDGMLERFWQETTIATGDTANEQAGPRVGDIRVGRVQRILSATKAAFVDIGAERAGYLSLRGGKHLARDSQASGKPIREGDVVLVQVVQEPIGDKGAKLSTKITIAQRLLVFTPQDPDIVISQRIQSASERERLTSLMREIASEDEADCANGFVVRTAALNASPADLRREAARLKDIWRAIRSNTGGAVPSIAFRDIGTLQRVMRQEVGDDVSRILIDDLDAVAEARAYASDAMPQFLDRIFHYDRGDLFDEFGVEDEVAALFDPRISLPSGGWIKIETTEAATTIDVNSGSHASSADPEAAGLAVNLEAAKAISRQIMLRDLGGLIVIDIMRLADPKNVARVRQAFVDALQFDHTPAEISVSPLGFIALTRKRSYQSLAARLTEVCSHCGGRGRRTTTEGVALDILRRVERSAAVSPGKTVTVRASRDVVRWLESRREILNRGFARHGVKSVMLIAEPERAGEHFSVETTG